MKRRTMVMAAVVIALASTPACGRAPDTTPARSASSTAASTATSSGESTATTTSSSSGVKTTPPSPPTSTGAKLKSIPVYYIAESQRSFKLYREFRTVPDMGGAIASAVSAMTRLAPLDADYMTPWRPASRIAVSQKGSNIAVDLSADAFSNSNVGSEMAATALQQLVYTATAAAAASGAPGATVRVTKDGTAADAWGVLRIGDVLKRAPMGDVQAQVWLTSPQDGDVCKAGRVVFTGFGTSFEATFGWVIRTADGARVAQGSAMGGTGTGGFGSLSFAVELAPGTYVVALSTDDPSGGEGRARQRRQDLHRPMKHPSDARRA